MLFAVKDGKTINSIFVNNKQFLSFEQFAMSHDKFVLPRFKSSTKLNTTSGTFRFNFHFLYHLARINYSLYRDELAALSKNINIPLFTLTTYEIDNFASKLELSN